MNDLSATSVVIPTAYETSLGLRGRVTETSWELPDDLSPEEWMTAGMTLGKVERSASWWIGDWWRACKPEWGIRAAFFERDDWEGAAYSTCKHAAAVCNAFEMGRRRPVLSFQHHAEVVPLSFEEADELLNWAEETVASEGKPRSTRELRGEVNRRRVTVGAQPSDETCTITDLEALVSSGRRFGCIYADPPWLYDNQGTRAATRNHYNGLTVDQLCKLPVRQLAADSAHLHLWVTNAFLRQAFDIIDAWGFEFRSTFVWTKPQMGIGNYWRNSHEIMLNAVRGEIDPHEIMFTAVQGDAKRFNDHSLRSYLQCDRGAHSAKPEQVRALIERASPGPYLEMFGRMPAQGWTVWGNQIERNLFTPGGIIE